MTEHSDESRREIVRRLEEEEQALNAQQAQLDRKRTEIKSRRFRAQLPFPSGDICPVCWIDHGLEAPMQPQPSGRGVDIFRCGSCGHTEERKA